VLLKGEKIAIFAYGSRVDSALEAGKALGGSVIDMQSHRVNLKFAKAW
jgi:transketolase C-terminal domain/subunit